MVGEWFYLHTGCQRPVANCVQQSVAGGPQARDAERRQATRTEKQRIEKAVISQEEREPDLQKCSSSVKELDLCPKENEKSYWIILSQAKLRTALHFEQRLLAATLQTAVGGTKEDDGTLQRPLWSPGLDFRQPCCMSPCGCGRCCPLACLFDCTSQIQLT